MITNHASKKASALKVTIVGTGYVGLVTGTCLAKWGHDVECVDRDSNKIAVLNNGGVPIYEPGLEPLVAAGIKSGTLKFSTEVARSASQADIVFIAVGTPQGHGDGQADLSAIYAVAREIAPALKNDAIVAVKSTVPVGTGDKVEGIISEVRGRNAITVISNPEFLKEGVAVADFLAPDRIIIGTESDAANAKLLALYAEAAAKDVPILFTRRRTAELTKCAANAFLATKISFMNELADLCEKVGADVLELATGLGLDRRIGKDFLNPGPGYGGSCLPKDTVALLRTARDHNATLNIVCQAVRVNEDRKASMTEKIVEAMQGNVAGKTIAILGISFKPNTDDMRESPSIPLIHSLQKLGAKIRAYDPAAMKHAKDVFTDVTFAANSYDCADGADAAVIVTDWVDFRNIDLSKLNDKLAGNVLVDLRNIIDTGAAAAAGLQLTGIGRANGITAPMANLDAVTTHRAAPETRAGQ
jgi:UDPglucose 6-dehydrogenase